MNIFKNQRICARVSISTSSIDISYYRKLKWKLWTPAGTFVKSLVVLREKYVLHNCFLKPKLPSEYVVCICMRERKSKSDEPILPEGVPTVEEDADGNCWGGTNSVFT